MESIDVWDSDNRYAGDKLEVVPPLGGENINGKAFIKPEGVTLPSDLPPWTYDSTEAGGQVVTFAQKGWISGAKILKKVKTQSAHASCGNKSVLIKIYPCDIGEVEVSTENVSIKASDVVNKILSWIHNVEIEAPTAKFNFENQWKEKPGSNEAIWIYRADVNFDPLIGVSGKALTIKPKKLDQLLKKIKSDELFKKFFEDINVELYVFLAGKFKPSLHFEKKVDGTYEHEVLQGKYSEIGIEGGGEVTVKPKVEYIRISAYAKLGNTMFFTTGAYAIEDKEIGMKLGIGHKGLEAEIGLEVKMPGILDPFTLGPYKCVIVPRDEIKPFDVPLYSFK